MNKFNLTLENAIQGEKFCDIADFVYSPNINVGFDDYNKKQNSFDIKKLKEINIIYTHTFYVFELFKEIKDVKSKIILITHNADNDINERYEVPECVIKWYAQNVDRVGINIESIPIGLENNRWLNKMPKIKKMIEKQKEIKNHKNWLYINHATRTHPYERTSPYKLFANKEWCTIKNGFNGLDFDSYLDDIYNHKFVLCPRGNGLDTHRFWETLYMGSFPVVIKNINNSYYHDLPVLFVRYWEEINDYLLYSKYEEMISKEWNYDKLDFNYWKNKILKTI